MKKLFTVCLPVEGDSMLLGYKKRGFGAGKWSGFGGKREPGETIIQTAHRELWEEAGIKCLDMSIVGLLEFRFRDGVPNKDVFMFRGDRILGKPVETEEMRPRWFRADSPPYDDMLPFDDLWFPLLLAQRPFIASYVSSASDVALSCTVHLVSLSEVIANLPAR